MKEKTKLWFQKSGRAVVTVTLVVVLLFSLFSNYKSAAVFHEAIGTNLDQIASACDDVRRASASAEGIGDYKEVSQAFFSNVWKRVNALQQLAQEFPIAYGAYNLENLEDFSFYILQDEDEGQQKKNIETICLLAQELEGITEQSGYGRFIAYPQKTKTKLNNVERICADWLSDYDARSAAEK